MTGEMEQTNKKCKEQVMAIKRETERKDRREKRVTDSGHYLPPAPSVINSGTVFTSSHQHHTATT